MLLLLVRAPPLTPDSLLKLLKLWKDFKSTPEYAHMREISCKKSEERVRAKVAEHVARGRWQRALRFFRKPSLEASVQKHINISIGKALIRVFEYPSLPESMLP